MWLSLRRPVRPRRRQWLRAALGALGALLVFAPAVWAERLPVRSYTAADGLAHDRVARIVRDSRGFLWFCTAGGLSRFDGRRFVSYSTSDGLPASSLNDLWENRDGSYWIATNGAGLVRYDPSAPGRDDSSTQGSASGRFSVFSIEPEPATNRINTLYRDQVGVLWIGTDGGLFAAGGETPRPAFHRFPLKLPSHPDDLLQVWAFLEGPDGSLWIGTSAGLVWRRNDGRSTLYRIRPMHGSDHVFALMMDADRRLWIGHDAGLLIARLDELEGATGDAHLLWFTASRRLEGTRVGTLLTSSAGHVWAGTGVGLYQFVADRSKLYAAAHGLRGDPPTSLVEDAYGNLWGGTAASGAFRIARNGLTTFTTADGLDNDVITMLFETRHGRLCAVTGGAGLNIFDGERFQAILPNLRRKRGDRRAEPHYPAVLHDRRGEWWIPSGETLYRFPPVAEPAALATISPRAVYDLGGGTASRGIWRLFEDSRGDVWIARRTREPAALMRLERATGTVHRYSVDDGLPHGAAHAFTEDRTGNLWIGFWDAGLVRYRDGHFEVVWADGMPASGVSAIHLDHANRLWFGTLHGLARVDDLEADEPGVLWYSTRDGLSDNSILTITEDQGGRMYIGTRRGVDRLDPDSGRIRHFSAEDGLPAIETRAAYRDRQGSLWFATGRGLSRLVPRPDPPTVMPTALLQSVRIDGIPQSLPDLGAVVAGPLKARAAGSRIEVEFFALFFQPGTTLKYQYRLDDGEPWSPPTEQPSVIYPRLPAGTYRFSVRAIRSDGAVSDTPAALTFTIPPPLWAQWWFVAAAATGILLLVHAAYRYRLSRLLEIERLRTRLAMDLHDDIGATLSQMAVLSEVARNRVAPDRGPSDVLERIAETSRQLIDSMSDVVWAINPERDSLRDLLQRMRRFGADALDARNIQFRFEGPADHLDAPLDGHVRRDVFLVFKEAIHNLMRHANCERADVTLQIDGGFLVLTIADDGVGVAPAAQENGLGLRSMRERAARLRASLTLVSSPGQGTTVRMVVPFGRPVRGPRYRGRRW